MVINDFPFHLSMFLKCCLAVFGVNILWDCHQQWVIGVQTLCAMLMAAMLGDPLGAPKGTTSASRLPFLLEDFLANAHMPFQSWLPGRMAISNSVHHVPVQPCIATNIYEQIVVCTCFMCAFWCPTNAVPSLFHPSYQIDENRSVL